MTLPILHVDGEPYDQGRQHGQALAALIAENLDVYFDRFEREGKLSPTEARQRAQQYQPILKAHRAYAAALQGIADGSRQPLQDIVVLNMRYELLYFQYGINALADGCTVFAALPEATHNGHLLMGQNWDWIPEVRGAVLHTRDDDGFETLAFTEAGIVGGKIGLNSSGLGLAINGLYTTQDDWSRLKVPFHVRCYDILRSRSLAEAQRQVIGTPRACSTNFLIAHADQAVDIEAAPDAARCVEPTDGTLVHSNHFLDPDQLGLIEPPVEKRPHSYHRQARLQTLLDARAPVSIGDLEACLRDHDDFPDSLCRHPHPDDESHEWVVTVTSVIMDLDERSLRLTDGQPCAHLYDAYSLAHTAVLGR